MSPKNGACLRVVEWTLSLIHYQESQDIKETRLFVVFNQAFFIFALLSPSLSNPHPPSMQDIKDEKAEYITQSVEEYAFKEDDNASQHQNEFGHGNGSWSTAYFNVVCVVAGTGTLGLPKAFATGGWLGILILFLAWGMSVYSGIVLIECLYHKPGERLHDFKQIGKAAFGMYSSCY